MLQAVVSLICMFAIQWIYALVTVVCVIAITVYISLANSAVFPGTVITLSAVQYYWAVVVYMLLQVPSQATWFQLALVISIFSSPQSDTQGQHWSKIMKPRQSLPLQMAERLLELN